LTLEVSAEYGKLQSFDTLLHLLTALTHTDTLTGWQLDGEFLQFRETGMEIRSVRWLRGTLLGLGWMGERRCSALSGEQWCRCILYQLEIDVSTGPSGTCMSWDGGTARKRRTSKQATKRVIFMSIRPRMYRHIIPSQSIYIHLSHIICKSSKSKYTLPQSGSSTTALPSQKTWLHLAMATVNETGQQQGHRIVSNSSTFQASLYGPTNNAKQLASLIKNGDSGVGISRNLPTMILQNMCSDIQARVGAGIRRHDASVCICRCTCVGVCELVKWQQQALSSSSENMYNSTSQVINQVIWY
jgi:hypothetical protein